MELQELINRIERWKMKSGLAGAADSAAVNEVPNDGFTAAGAMNDAMFEQIEAEEELEEVSASFVGEPLEEAEDAPEEEGLVEEDALEEETLVEDALVEEEDLDLESEDVIREADEV